MEKIRKFKYTRMYWAISSDMIVIISYLLLITDYSDIIILLSSIVSSLYIISVYRHIIDLIQIKKENERTPSNYTVYFHLLYDDKREYMSSTIDLSRELTTENIDKIIKLFGCLLHITYGDEYYEVLAKTIKKGENFEKNKVL